MSTKHYLRQNILLLATNVLAGAFAYLLHPVLGRMLSIQEYGQVAVFLSLALILSTFTQSIATVAAKYTSAFEVEQREGRLRFFFTHLTLLLSLTGLFVTLVFLLLSGSLARVFNLGTTHEVQLLSLLCLVLFVMPLNQGILQGLQLFGWYATITLLVAVLRLLLVPTLILLGMGINGSILGLVLASLLTYLISFLPLRKLVRRVQKADTPATSRSLAGVPALVGPVVVTGLVSLGVVALSSLDTVLARRLLSQADTGLYAALATMGRTILFVTNGVAIVLFPKVVTLVKRGESPVRLTFQALLGVLLLAGSVELVFCLFSHLITRLLFGAAFLSIASYLPLYGLAMLSLALAQVLAFSLLAQGQRLFVGAIIGVCCVLVALLCWHHATLLQVVQGVCIANALLAVSLCLIWLGSFRPRSRFREPIPARPVEERNGISLWQKR